MAPKACILAIGGEILDGRIHDTNANRFVLALQAIDIPVIRTAACSDNIKEICSALEFLSSAGSVILCSGGLGPTTDDLTREAVAEFTGDELVEDQQAMADLEQYFHRKQRPFDESNRKQALIPSRAEPIHNPIGSAPGFRVRFGAANGRKNIICLPGVPRELTLMLSAGVVPFLESEFPNRPPMKSAIIRLFGLPEARVGDLAQAVELPPGVALSYRATFPEIQLRISGAEAALLDGVRQQLEAAIGRDFVFSNSLDESLPAVVHALLLRSKQTLAVAESCTGGMLGAMLTQGAGASAFFNGGVISYSNSLKESLLSVAPETIEGFGAVSHETARAMARGVRKAASSDLAVSITGIAGPEGGSQEKPVGTFFVGFADRSGAASYRFFFNGEREGVRRFAAASALDVIRRRALKLPIHAVEQENGIEA